MAGRRKGRIAASEEIKILQRGLAAFSQAANPPDCRDEFDLGVRFINDREGSSYRLTPERRLCCAMIHRAVLDYVGDATSTLKGEVQTAFRWIYHGKSSNHPFSFLWCCDAIAEDGDKYADAIREQVAAVKRNETRAA